MDKRDDAPEADQPPVHVLVVEDDYVTLEFLTRLVTWCGATSGEAISLREAREVMERESFDVLITDYRLRDGTGIDVARAAQGVIPHVVLVSGSSTGIPMDDVTAAGVVSFIPKYELSGARVCELLRSLVGDERGLRQV